jgi:hypothetical protein
MTLVAQAPTLEERSWRPVIPDEWFRMAMTTCRKDIMVASIITPAHRTVVTLSTGSNQRRVAGRSDSSMGRTKVSVTVQPYQPGRMRMRAGIITRRASTKRMAAAGQRGSYRGTGAGSSRVTNHLLFFHAS